MKSQSKTVSYSFDDILLSDFLGKEKEIILKLLPRTIHGIILIDKEGKFIYVNEEFTNLTGYTLADTPSGSEWLKKAFPNPTIRERVVEFWKSDMQKKGAHRVYQVVCKGGHSKLFHFRCFQLDDGRAISTLSDITEQHMVDESIREVDEKFHTLLGSKKPFPESEAEDDRRLPESKVQKTFPISPKATLMENGIEKTEEEDEATEKKEHSQQNIYTTSGNIDMPATTGKEPVRDNVFSGIPFRQSGDEKSPTASETGTLALQTKVFDYPAKNLSVDTKRNPGNNGTATVLIEENQAISMADREFELLSGYSREEIESKKGINEFLSPEDLSAMDDYLKSCCEKQDAPPGSFEFKFFDRYGVEKSISMTIAIIPGTKRRIGTIRDITEEKLHREIVSQARKSFDDLIKEYAPIAIITVNAIGKIEFANREMLRMSGAYSEQLRAISVFDHTGYKNADLDTKIRKGLKGEPFRAESVEYISYFSQRRVTRNFTGIPFDEAGEKKLLIFIEDITRENLNEQQLAYQATHDILTGLPNMALYNDRLKLAIQNANQYEQKLAVMFLDIDKFKGINYTLGYKMGDEILKSVADRVRRIIRQSDTIARIGGDEFILLIQNINRINDADTVAEKILESFHQPFIVGSHTLDISCSVGISLYPDNGNDMGNLVKCADIAMNNAKIAGRNRFRRFTGTDE